LARIDALGRRGHHTPASVSEHLQVDDLVLDLSTMRARRGDTTLDLTARELALLELLMRHPGRLFSRERILANVWGTHEDPLTNVVDVYIRRLRSKIDDGQARTLIHTVRGLGYRLE
jgi:DNA-binding response OmpR family regulator